MTAWPSRLSRGACDYDPPADAPQAGRQASATLQPVIPLAIPRPRPRLKRRVLRSYVATETALQPWPPALRSTPRAPGRHRAITTFCHGCLLVARRVPLRFPPHYALVMGRAASSLRSGTSHAKRSVRPQRCLPSVDLVYPALFPCCASPFPLRLRGLRQPYDELHYVPSIVRLPPSATAHHSLRITTPQQRPPVARYANSAVRSRHPSGGERSVRTSLHAIRRRCSVHEPAQLARCASPARKLAPKRKSCSGTPCPDAILRKLRNATRHSIPTHLSHPAMNRTTSSCLGRRTVHCPRSSPHGPRRSSAPRHPR